jgi:hypothetical protein
VTGQVRWYVTDSNGSRLGSVAANGGMLGWDGSALGQRRATGVTFDRRDWANVNPYTDWLQPVWKDSDGRETSLGLLTVLTDGQAVLSEGVLDNPTPYLLDGSALLIQPSLTTLSARVGERLSELIGRVLDVAGVRRYVVASTGWPIGEPVSHPPGTTYAEALNGLATLAGYLPPHFDRDGTCKLVPPPMLSDRPAVEYDATSIVRYSRLMDDELLQAANTFLVVGSGATATPITAVAEVPPSEPNSVTNRGGRRIVQVIQEQGIESVPQAERLARMAAISASASLGAATFQTVPNPVHDCYTLVAVDGVTYRQLEWSLDLAPGGLMTHRLTRTVPVVAQ